MDKAITPTSALNAAPVLTYYTSTAPPVGLRVEETPTEWVLELHPPTVRTELAKSVAWATVVAVALALTPLVVIHLRSNEFDPRVGPAASALVFLAGWPLMFAARLLSGLAMRVSLRIAVSPDLVCWTVSGFRLSYEISRRRDEIAAVELRLHGVRLKRFGRRGGDWIAFGTRDEQRQICQLLGEALGVPVRGVRKPPSPVTPGADSQDTSV
jgi:hypothetical protein